MKLPNPIDSLTFPWNYIAAGVAILALVAAIVFGTVQCKRINQENTKTIVQTGVVAEREQNHQEVINHVQEAHEAVVNPTPAERSGVCSKYDRNCPVSK
jgi:Cu/Ag efflux pump CusA